MGSIRMHWGHFREQVHGVSLQLAHTQQNAYCIHEHLLSSLYLKITHELAHSYSIKQCGSASHYFLLMFLLISQIKSTWLKTESSSPPTHTKCQFRKESAPFCSCRTASGAALSRNGRWLANGWWFTTSERMVHTRRDNWDEEPRTAASKYQHHGQRHWPTISESSRLGCEISRAA